MLINTSSEHTSWTRKPYSPDLASSRPDYVAYRTVEGVEAPGISPGLRVRVPGCRSLVSVRLRGEMRKEGLSKILGGQGVAVESAGMPRLEGGGRVVECRRADVECLMR